MRDEFVVLDGLRFRYREWGDSDAAPVVLLHGVLMYADPYDTIAKQISATGRRVIMLDQRGHGQSEHSTDYSWQSCERDLERLWAALRLGNVAVIAHSWGAEHACHLAAMQPDAVERLAVIDNPLGAGLSPESGAFWTTIAELAPADGFENLEHFINVTQRLIPRAQHDELVRQSRGLVERDGRWHWKWSPDPAVFLASDRNQPLDGMREMCSRVHCPVLVVRAEHSELFAAEDLDRVVSSFPAARGTTLPASGHMIMWENPTVSQRSRSVSCNRKHDRAVTSDARRLTDKLVVRQSHIAGVGLFAVEPIERGEVCCRLSGALMNNAEFARYIAGRSRYSALAIDEDLNLVQEDDDPTTKGNHSCDPNMWLSDAVTVVARHPIGIDVEATIDYALLTVDERWSMECNCGAAVCRGVVRGSDWRRSDLWDRYRGHWSPFIERRIEQAASGQLPIGRRPL